MILALLTTPAFGQDVPAGFERYTVSNGLSSRTAYYCIQDHKGFLWVGTDVGVSRFDGYRFVHYTMTDGLGDNEIVDLYEDGLGRIWFIPLSGKLSYYYNDTIHNCNNDALLKQLPPQFRFNCPAEDEQHNLYFLEGNGSTLLTIRPTGTFKRSRLNELLEPGERPQVLHRDENGRDIYCITQHNQFILLSGTGSPRKIMQPRDHQLHFFTSNPKSKRTLSYTDDGIYAWRHTIPEKVIDFRAPLIRNQSGVILFMDKENNIWLTRAHYNTMFFSMSGGIYKPGLPVLEHQSVIVSQDNEQQLWFCNSREGMYKIPYTTFLNMHTDSLYKALKNKNTPATVVFSSRDGYIWTGDIDGYVIRMGSTGLKQYNLNIGTTQNNKVQKIAADKKGNIWVATNQSLYLIRKKPEGYAASAEWATEPDGKRMNGAFKGFTFDTAGNIYPIIAAKVYRPILQPGNPRAAELPLNIELNNLRLFSNYFDITDHWYVSTARGIYHAPANAPLLLLGGGEIISAVRDYDLAEDSSVLMATSANGVLAVKEGRIVAFFDQHKGLPGQTCRKLCVRNDTVFIATNNGISIVRYSQQRFTPIGYLGVQNGLLSGDVTDITFSGDMLLAATSAGVSPIRVSVLNTSSPAPVITFLGFSVDNRNYLKKQPIRLSYPTQNIRISFIAPSLAQPEQTIYRYQLENQDGEWQETSSDQVEFSNLSYGKYRFNVQARKYNSDWSKIYAISFVISPPFYATYWFRITVALSVISGLYYTYILLLRSKVKKQLALLREEQVLENERNRIASDLHDDIGSELTNIIMLSHMLNQEDGPAGQKQIINRLEVSSQRVVRNMNEVIRTLNAKDDSLHNLAGYLRMEVKQYLTNNQLQHELLVDDTVYAPLPISAVWHRHIILLVKEILHNIVKHAAANKVAISMQLQQDILIIDIRDDGKGFNAAAVSSGNGLHNMKKRIDHLKGTFSITSDTGQGTRVHIAIPVNNTHEN